MASFSSRYSATPVGSAERFRRRVAANPAVLQTMQTGTGPTGLLPNDRQGWSDLQNDYSAFLDEQRAQQGQGPRQVRAPARSAGHNGGVGVLSGGNSAPRRSGGGSEMPRGLTGSGGGRFDPTDDPRVQQALIQQALTALEPDEFAFDAGGGRMMAGSRRDVDRTNQFARGLDETRQEAGLEEDLAAEFEPKRADRKLDLARTFGPDMARVNAEIGDIGSEAEARREWLPYRAGISERDFNRRRELAVGPAEVAAAGRQGAETIRAGATVGAANARRPDAAATVAEAIAQMTRSGAFGIDEEGRPVAPPAELQNRMREELLGMLGRGGSPGAPMPQAPGPGGQSMTSGPTVPPNPGPGARHRFPNGTVAEWDGTGWAIVGG